MKKSLLFLALLISPFFIFAQNKITGKLLDEKKQALSFASAQLMRPDSTLQKVVASDDNGIFTFEDILKGKYYVEISFLGYEKFSSPVFEINQKNIELTDIQLNILSNELKEVAIVARKPLLEMRGDKLIMNIESSPIASQGTALEALQRAPGVVIRQEKEISLRGKSGILVMIDDKITQMSQEDLARYLQSMPATMIDKIEIINNPSARYDAAGTAGIINIKLKKDKNLGFNGNISSRLSYGRTPKGNLSSNLNYRNQKVNLFGNISADHWAQDNRQFFERDIFTATNKTTFDQKFIQDQKENSLFAKIGADFFLNKNTTLGIMTTGSTAAENMNFDNTIDVLGYNSDDYAQLFAEGINKTTPHRIAYNVNFKHVLDTLGREFTIDADYSTFMKKNTQDVNNMYLNSAKQETKTSYRLRNNNQTDFGVFAAKADYIHPFKNKSVMELGWKSSWVGINNAIFFEQKLADNSWLPQTNRNNDFEYDENINAAYINYNFPVGKKINIQSGLRIENTNNKGYSKTLDSTITRGYTNFFPTANINYTLNDKNMLSFSYSLRVNRPSYEDLNPFIFYIDEFTYGKGNPYLRPEFTNAVSISHTFREMLSTTVYYAKTKDAIMQVLAQEPNSRIGYQTTLNFADYDNFSFTIASPIPIKKWWNSNASVTGFWNSYRGTYLTNTLNNQQWSWNFNLDNSFTLSKSVSAELSGWINTPLVYGVFKMKSQGSVDFGISKKFKNGAKLKFSVRDIFKTSNFRANVDDNGLIMRVRNDQEPRRANISFSTPFGNKEVKAARNRKTATEEEMGRVKK
jgi:hypothetical protein